MFISSLSGELEVSAQPPIFHFTDTSNRHQLFNRHYTAILLTILDYPSRHNRPDTRQAIKISFIHGVYIERYAEDYTFTGWHGSEREYAVSVI